MPYIILEVTIRIIKAVLLVAKSAIIEIRKYALFPSFFDAARARGSEDFPSYCQLTRLTAAIDVRM